MKDRLIELMKTNLDLVESSIHLYVENKNLRTQVAFLQDRVESAIQEKNQLLLSLTQNQN